MSDNRPLRYRWLDIVMGWPHERIGKYKAVAYWIAQKMFDGEIDVFPSLDTLAEWAGMSKRTVSTALDELEAEGLIGRKSGGGKARASHYWLNLPCSMLQGLDGDTLQGFDEYVARIEAKHCKESADTLQLVATEHIRNLSEPISEPIEIESVAPASPIAPSPDIAMEDGRASLPAPDFKIRAMWTDRWPDESEMLPRHPTENCAMMIGVHAARILGYSPGQVVPMGTNGVYLDRQISDQMAPVLMAKLSDRMARGKLRAIDLATALADMGYAPEQPKLAEREKAL